MDGCFVEFIVLLRTIRDLCIEIKENVRFFVGDGVSNFILLSFNDIHGKHQIDNNFNNIWCEYFFFFLLIYHLLLV